jgi:hypothetical protein
VVGHGDLNKRPAGHFPSDVDMNQSARTEVGRVNVVGYGDVNKTMTEVGWVDAVGYEDVKQTAGHFPSSCCHTGYLAN